MRNKLINLGGGYALKRTADEYAIIRGAKVIKKADWQAPENADIIEGASIAAMDCCSKHKKRNTAGNVFVVCCVIAFFAAMLVSVFFMPIAVVALIVGFILWAGSKGNLYDLKHSGLLADAFCGEDIEA